jgi:hypothetical protein
MNKGIMAVATLVIFLAFCPVAAWSQTSGRQAGTLSD